MKRTGFTLIELLVVMGVIGVLVSISLPAVQRSREASRRASCQSNLKQIGIALHAYEASFHVFPAGSGGYVQYEPIGGDGRYFSPFVYLLPGLEQRSLYNSINFQVKAYDPSTGWDGPENRTAFNRNVELFLCPSDAWPSGGEGGRMNYRVNLGTGPMPFGPTNNGAFPTLTWTTSASFADGLSMTAAISERVKGDGNPERYTPSADVWLTEPQGSFPSLDELRILCPAPSAANPPHQSNVGASWFHAGFYWTWYNHGLTPNHSTPDCTTGNWLISIPGLFSARSLHPGGVNLMMMDGSVRFVHDSIDLEIWQALATRNGGEHVERSGF